MHNRWEELRHRGEFSRIICQLLEKFSKGREILSIVISLDSCIFYFLFQLAERISVCTLASLQKSQDSFNLDWLELRVDGIEIVRFSLPELELNFGTWIFAVFECLLGLQL